MRGFDGLKENLSPNFTLLEEDNMNAVVRFSPRMYNILNCHITVWKEGWTETIRYLFLVSI